MPELPEVETVKRQLEKQLSTKPQVLQLKALRADLRFPFPNQMQMQNMKSKNILGVDRRAKYLLFDLGDTYLLSHLGMTGYWRFLKDEFLEKHDHFLIQLSTGESLVYNDHRRFGFVDLIEKKNFENSKWFSHLGPEPWDQLKFNAEYFIRKAKKSDRSVKVFLMDQAVVVGVGNIYASEALFLAKIDPRKKAGQLKPMDWQRLVEIIPDLLRQAVQSGGTTLRDYRNVYGESGGHQNSLWVYGQQGLPCKACGELIQRLVLGARSSFYCPGCQS